MPNRQNNRLKTVSLVILIVLAGRVLGLGRDMLLGQTFGTGWEADALSVASNLPRIFFDAIFSSAVAASFIPVFTETAEREGRASADRLAGSFFTVVGLVSATLTVLGMVFAPRLVDLMAPLFDEQTTALAARLLTIIFPSLFFTGLAFSMVGVLQSLGEFNIPAAMSIASNGILIVYFLFFARRFGVYGAAVALTIGWAAQAVMQLPSLWKRGFRYRPGLRHPGLKKIFKLMLPVMVSTWIAPINMLIIFWFASGLPGGVASLNYANGLFLMVAGIFVLSVTNVIFPEMSRLSAEGDRRAFCDMVRETTRTLLFLLIPMTVGLMLLATPVVRLLYEYRQFDADSTALTASALAFMSLGMAGYGIQNVLIRAFYAEKRGKIPLLAGLVGVAANILFCMLFAGRMGVAGLSLASAASLLVTALVLVPAAHKMLGGGLVTRGLALALGKMICAALVMGAAVWWLQGHLAGIFFGDSIWMRLGLVAAPAAVGLTLYLGLAAVMRLDEINVLRGYLRKHRREGA